MPLLSVLMSAYKSGSTIDRAVSSTLRAMPVDSELVVVVDGPDQPTEEALDRFTDRRLRVRVDPVNRGLAAQLRDMAEAADSLYIARMDSDDICLPGRFRLTLPHLRASDFVFASGLRFGHRKLLPGYPLSMTARDVATGLLFYNPLFHPTMCCRSAALREVGGYSVIPYGEDVELWTRAAGQGKTLVKLAVPTLAYRLSATQMSASTEAANRLMVDPDYMRAYAMLADRMGVGEHLDSHGRLSIAPEIVASLLAMVTPWNRPYMRRRIADSPLTA